jgi:hypothetical protein
MPQMTIHRIVIPQKKRWEDQGNVWGPLCRLPKEKPFLVWDVETKPAYPGEPINTQWLGAGLYDGIGAPQIFTNEKEFFNALLAPCYKKHWIYAHNASGFDFHYLLRNLIKRDVDWTGYRTGARLFMRAAGREFFDSMAILRGSLANIGDELGLHVRKWDLDSDPDFYKDIERRPWREYLADDLRSLFEAIQITRENFSKLGGILQPTIASTAMTLFRYKYMDCEIQNQPISSPLPDTWRKAYFGGRVEVFKPEMQAGGSWDINSSYPASMVDPAGIPCEFSGIETGDNLPAGPAICQATIEIPPDERHPPLVVVGDDRRLYFPTGRRSGWFTTEELNYCAGKYGRKAVRVHETHNFRARPLFDAYVKDIYAIKQKKAGVLSYVAKLALNSLYGKTGMKRDREQIVCGAKWHNWPWDDPKAMDNFKRDGIEPYKRVISHDDYLYTIPTKANRAAYIMPQIAATVTARSRIRLQGLLDVAGQASCYCDTDSIYAELPRSAFQDTKELGGLKYEGEIQRAIFAAPKVYWVLEKNGKAKGRAKGVCYKDAAEVLHFIQGGTVTKARMVGIFERWHRSTIEIVDTPKGKKKIRRKCDGVFSEFQEKRAQSWAARRDFDHDTAMSIHRMEARGVLKSKRFTFDNLRDAYLWVVPENKRVNFVKSDMVYWQHDDRQTPWKGGELDPCKKALGMKNLKTLAQAWDKAIGTARAWLDPRVQAAIELMQTTVGPFTLPEDLQTMIFEQQLEEETENNA